jgi:membrane AbrB-like protein
MSTVTIGALFTYLSIPAGWLLGALWCGIIVRIIDKSLSFGPKLIKLSQVFIGISIGLMIKTNFFTSLLNYLLPFLLCMLLIILCGLMLGFIFQRYSGLDPITAFFCCIPGGATEVIAVSNEYGANEKIVAAFHSARIVFIVSTIPFILSIFFQSDIGRFSSSNNSFFPTSYMEMTLIGLAILIAYFLSVKHMIPAGALVFSILIGLVISMVFSNSVQPPRLLIGMGQAWIGGIIGLRFDKETFSEIWRIGWIALITLLLYLILGIGVAFVFYLTTPLDLGSSILSVIPAGAVEMTSIALFLHLDATLVAFMQISRLIIMFLTMPKIIKMILTHQTKLRIRSSNK